MNRRRFLINRAIWIGSLLAGAGGIGLLHAVARQTGAPADAGAPPVEFVRDIRPILADHCFACHGPDSATRQAGFRFDIRDSAFGQADSGEHPIVAGDPAGSEMIRRLTTADEDERMPPPESKKQLTEPQIAMLQRWIEQGAPWQEHWAFIPPRRPEIPAVDPPDWPRNPIDHFVLAQLGRRGLSPAAEADKTTLVRRLYLDLTGLPPAPQDVDEFLADPSPHAWEALVDRLLDSPRYGEHMATFWLDAARFADTNGYQNDFRRSMWLWRDWVIQAFNDNMPYDQFAIEQIAGDLLPDATLDQRIATGFNRNHRMNTEGGSINEEWLVENVVDRVETTSTVFLGLTLGCARCHDHKFDPVTQTEFYEFFAFFNNIEEQGVYEETRGNVPPLVAVPTPEYQARLQAAREQVAAARQVVHQLEQELAGQQRAWEAELAETQPVAVPEPPLALLSPDYPTRPLPVSRAIEQARSTHAFTDQPPGPAIEIAPGENRHLNLGEVGQLDAAQPVTISAWVRPVEYGAIISRMDEGNAYRGFDMLIMPDGRMNVHLIHDWPGNATKITTTPVIPKARWSQVVVVWEPPGKAANIRVYLNGQPAPCTVDADSLEGTILTDHPLWLGLRARTSPFSGMISDVQIRNCPLNDDAAAALYRRGLTRMMAGPPDQRSDALQADLQYHFRLSHPAYSGACDHLRNCEQELAETQQQIPTTMVMAERQVPRETWVLQRGQYDRPDKSKPVVPGVPALFHTERPLANRLDLARWLVDGSNPLTARVAVNHFWARYFGIGLLETAENFGTQSPPPSHPELLDWLATELVRTGWDIKGMQRLIVTSATYRQSSRATPAAYQRDPQNRWLARGPRFRLPAETVRDNALAIGGLLTERIGGPSIKPYQPDGLWEELAGGAREPAYQIETGDDLYRRSLYIYRKRTVPHPTMTTFDGASRDVCQVARSRTNTPLQALALLNDMTYVEAARHLAIRSMDFADRPEQQLRFAFRCATARWPEPAEQAVLCQALDRYRRQFVAAPDSAQALIENGQSPVDPRYDPVELAALTTLCSVILNLDETITRE